MSSFKTVALTLGVVLVSAAAAQAAPMHRKPVHHMSHPMKHHSAMSGRGSHESMARGSMAAGDHSADALNAQSLARSQGAAQ